MVWTTGVKTTTKNAVTKAGKAHLLTGWVVLDPGVQPAVQELLLSVDLLQESLGLNDLLRGRQPSLRTPPFSQSCRGHAQVGQKGHLWVLLTRINNWPWASCCPTLFIKSRVFGSVFEAWEPLTCLGVPCVHCSEQQASHREHDAHIVPVISSVQRR